MRKIKMDVNENNIRIEIKIKGLVGNNYKLYITQNNLSIAALTQTKAANNKTLKYAFKTSSFILPCLVNKNSISSYIKNGMLIITLERTKNLKSKNKMFCKAS
ncbi:MAG: Hsp20/alpha crystallin family protein [Vicingaceae bacterium]